MNKSYQVLNYALTDVGNVRTNNEDFFGSMQLREGNLFIVCDGMGAHQAGEQASSMCVNLIKEFFSSQASGNPAIDIYNAILFANEQIYVAAQVNDDFKGMGTTVAVLMITQNEIHVGHVGDSRVYILTDGQLFQLTKDHSFVQGLVDQGLISKEEMERHSRKNELTNAIGIFQQVKPTISKSSINAKVSDRFLLCSDGLNGMISDEDIRHEMKKEQTIDSMCVNLISHAKIAGGHDNITVSCVEIIKSPFASTNLEGAGLHGQINLTSSNNLLHATWFQLLIGISVLVCSILGYLVYTDELGFLSSPLKDEVQRKNMKITDSSEMSVQQPDERDKKKENKNTNNIKESKNKKGNTSEKSGNKKQTEQNNKATNAKAIGGKGADSKVIKKNANIKGKDSLPRKNNVNGAPIQQKDKNNVQDSSQKSG
jgi:serine/threonine protein phosphatase PrpC